MQPYVCDRDALVQACFSKYDQKFKNSSEKVKQAKFGKCSKQSSAIGEEVFGEARNSSAKIEAFCFSNFQKKNICRDPSIGVRVCSQSLPPT